MPLHTQIIRDGEPLQLRWGHFHIAAMAISSCADARATPQQERIGDLIEVWHRTNGSEPMPITSADAFSCASYGVLGVTPLNDGPYTLTKGWTFTDAVDGETLDLLPGDVLVAYR